MIQRWEYDSDFHILTEDKEGTLIDIADCMIAEQEGIMMGDPLDVLNKQIQKQVGEDNGPFDIMIIMKKREN